MPDSESGPAGQAGKKLYKDDPDMTEEEAAAYIDQLLIPGASGQ